MIGIPLLPLLALLAQGAPLPPPPPPPPPPITAGDRVDGTAARSGTASLSGTVVSDEPVARPLRNAVVMVSGSGLQPARVVVTDDDGRFRVDRLPDGAFTVRASKAAFVEMAYGQKRPGRGSGSPVALAPGQHVGDLVVRLPRGAVIAGRVFGERGQPNAGVRVSVLEFDTVNGERQLQPVSGVGFFGALGLETDDRGVYRIYGLPPGEYVISAALSPFQVFGASQGADLRRVTPAEVQWAASQLSGSGTGAPVAAAGASVRTPAPPPGQSLGLATVYYPGTTDPSAAALVAVAAGEERDGVDFGVTLVPSARVSGRVTGPDGQPVPGVQLLFAPASAGVPTIMSLGGLTRTDARGTFTSSGLPPGTYRLMARTPMPPAMPVLVNGVPAQAPARPADALAGYWASTDVSVNGQDIDGLALTLQPGLTLAGRLVFEPSADHVPAPEPSRVRVMLLPVQAGLSVAGPATQTANDDGTFELIGITPGQYRLSAGIQSEPGSRAASWSVKTAALGGRDAADRLIEIAPDESLSGAVITFIDRTAEVDGRLLDALGRPTTEYSAMLFSTNPDHWFIGGRRVKAPVRPSTDGRFRFTGLPSGEYFMAAVSDVNPRDLGNRAFLEQIAASAIRVTVAEGEKKTQDLRLAAP